MKSHLPDHSQIYVPIRLRCNHEISYKHYMRVHMQVLWRHQAAFAKVSNDFQCQCSCRCFLDRINLHQIAISLKGLRLNTSCHLL